VRDRSEDVLDEPLAEERGTLGLARGAEISRLARERQQMLAPTRRAADAGETSYQPSALEERVDGGLYQRTQGAEAGLEALGMPGRFERFGTLGPLLAGLSRVVSLAPLEEIRTESPDYHETILAETLPCRWQSFEIPDYGVPADRTAFWQLARDVARSLAAGERILIHCGVGVGRTATLAVATLLALGLPLADAVRIVHAAGSGCETNAQKDEWCAERVPRAR
jgi:hypothetical protein